MADFSLEDLAEPVASASNNFAVKVGAGALKFGCILYREFPAAIVGQNPNAFVRGLLDTLCDDREPLPPPPTIPFVGGQCGCVLYDVQFRFNTGETDNGVVYGQIGGARAVIREVSPNYYSGRFECFCRGTTLTGCLPEQQWVLIGSSPGVSPNTTFNIVSVSRVDGRPDNCGNIPPSYPPSTIPPSRLQGSITNIYNDGSSFTLPIVYAPITGSIPIKFDVGGVPFKFDFGGLTIGDGGNPPVDLEPILLRLDKIDADLYNVIEDAADIKGDLIKVDNDVVKIKKSVDKPPPKPGSEDYDEDVKPPESPPEESGIEALSYVQLELINIPKNSKNQSGNESPTVFYAGWFEFRTGVFCYPREPIHFQFNLFEAPTGADGYAYCVYIGYEAQVTVFKHKNDDPPIG